MAAAGSEHSGAHHSTCASRTDSRQGTGEATSQPSPVLLGILITEALQAYLKVVMALNYEEKPPYATLRNNLEALLKDLRVSPYDPLDLQMVP